MMMETQITLYYWYKDAYTNDTIMVTKMIEWLLHKKTMIITPMTKCWLNYLYKDIKINDTTVVTLTIKLWLH